ncbi:unnamed protein product [Effrenium voratum]|nr:unnamed protein product [Effrenium voratum]
MDWGGLPSALGYNAQWHSNPVLHCMLADFGNSCYNDHHYHFGYFVVAGAILAKLRPEWVKNTDFVDFVDGLVRDTSNPSSEDEYFPRFRSFDWFDLHSWSRGLAPNPAGKDEESISEELNLHYGIHLWGRQTGRASLQKMGAAMLALAITTVQEFFLMSQGNPHHPQDYARNRAAGLLLQNEARYSTYFGNRFEYIHGIQMLPLTPALMLARTPEFNKLEWSEILCNLPLSTADRWTSILLTGNLAMFDPETAFERLQKMSPQKMDDGLTKAWALYWANAQANGGKGNWSCGKPPFHGPRVCPTGQYRSGVQCVACPAGTYNNLTNQTSVDAAMQALEELRSQMAARWPYDRYRSRAEDLSAPSFTLWIAARLGGCARNVVPSVQFVSESAMDFVRSALVTHEAFNLAQMLQAENVPGSVVKLQHHIQQRGEEDLRFYLLFLLGFMSGLSGGQGSTWMNAKNAEGTLAGIQMLQQLMTSTPRGIYWGFLSARADALAIPRETTEDLALLRLSVLARLQSAEGYAQLRASWDAVGTREKTVLTQHLLADGIEERAFILEFLPALVSNAHRNRVIGLTLLLEVLVSLLSNLQPALAHMALDSDRKMVRVDLSDMAEFVAAVQNRFVFQTCMVRSRLRFFGDRLQLEMTGGNWARCGEPDNDTTALAHALKEIFERQRDLEMRVSSPDVPKLVDRAQLADTALRQGSRPQRLAGPERILMARQCPQDSWSAVGIQRKDACIPCARDRNAHPSCSSPTSSSPSTPSGHEAGATSRTPATTATTSRAALRATSSATTAPSKATRPEKLISLDATSSGTESVGQAVQNVMLVAALLWAVSGATTACCQLYTSCL